MVATVAPLMAPLTPPVAPPLTAATVAALAMVAVLLAMTAFPAHQAAILEPMMIIAVAVIGSARAEDIDVVEIDSEVNNMISVFLSIISLSLDKSPPWGVIQRPEFRWNFVSFICEPKLSWLGSIMREESRHDDT